MLKERRRFKRARLDRPIRLRLFLPSSPETGSPFYEGRLFDISRGGVRISTNTVQSGGLHILHPSVARQEQAHLEIEILGDDAPLCLVGTVAWYNRADAEADFTFEVGVRFVDLPQETKDRLEALIRRAPG